jgi:hypothetical protein
VSADNPWAGLPRSEVGHLHAKRVDPSHPHDFFWACNPDGKYAFVLLLKDFSQEWQTAVGLRGISVLLYPEQKQLQLVLAESTDWQMFAALCRDLMDCSRNAATTREVMDALIVRLARWQRLLSRGPRRILDEREIRGLIGELLFLRDELMPRLGAKAPSCWQGPEGKPQDFVVGPALFEVKTIRPGDSPKIQIASLDQLWSGGLPLYLCVIPLASCGADTIGAITLPKLAEQLSRQLMETEGFDDYESGLAAAGYIPYPEYDEYAFLVGTPAWFEVTDGFPLINPETVPDGAVDVKYAIRLSACERFRSSPDWIAVMEQAR